MVPYQPNKTINQAWTLQVDCHWQINSYNYKINLDTNLCKTHLYVQGHLEALEMSYWKSFFDYMMLE